MDASPFVFRGMSQRLSPTAGGCQIKLPPPLLHAPRRAAVKLNGRLPFSVPQRTHAIPPPIREDRRRFLSTGGLHGIRDDSRSGPGQVQERLLRDGRREQDARIRDDPDNATSAARVPLEAL